MVPARQGIKGEFAGNILYSESDMRTGADTQAPSEDVQKNCRNVRPDSLYCTLICSRKQNFFVRWRKVLKFSMSQPNSARGYPLIMSGFGKKLIVSYSLYLMKVMSHKIQLKKLTKKPPSYAATASKRMFEIKY